MGEAHAEGSQELIPRRVDAVAAVAVVEHLRVTGGGEGVGLEIGETLLARGRDNDLELLVAAADRSAAHGVDEQSLDEVGEPAKAGVSLILLERSQSAYLRCEPVHPYSPEVRELPDRLDHTVELRGESRAGQPSKLRPEKAWVATDDDYKGEKRREEDGGCHGVGREGRDELSEGGKVCGREASSQRGAGVK